MGGIMLDSTNPEAVIEAVAKHRTWRNMEIRAGACHVRPTTNAARIITAAIMRLICLTSRLMVSDKAGEAVGKV